MAAIAAMAIVPATDRLSLVDKTAHCFIVPSTDLPPRSKYLFVQPFPPLPSANLTQRATLWRDPGVYARPIGQKQLFAGVERHRYIVSFYATSPCLAGKANPDCDDSQVTLLSDFLHTHTGRTAPQYLR